MPFPRLNIPASDLIPRNEIRRIECSSSHVPIRSSVYEIAEEEERGRGRGVWQGARRKRRRTRSLVSERAQCAPSPSASTPCLLPRAPRPFIPCTCTRTRSCTLCSLIFALGLCMALLLPSSVCIFFPSVSVVYSFLPPTPLSRRLFSNLE